MIDTMTDEARGVTSGTLGATLAGWHSGYAYGPVRWVNSSNAPRWGIDAGQIAGARKGERLRKQTAAAHLRIKESRASPGVLIKVCECLTCLRSYQELQNV